MKKKINAAGAALLTVLALAAIIVFTSPSGGDSKREVAYTAASETESIVGVSEASTHDSRVRMMCVGDNLIHSGIYKQARARTGADGYDFSYAYAKVAPLLSRADFAVLNQETVIDDAAEPSNFPLFNSPPQLGEQMISLGFNVINHANNHVLDQGASGAARTLDFWHSHDGIVLTGLYSDTQDMAQPKVNTVNGITFAHVGLTEYLNGMQLPTDSRLRIVSPTGAGITREEFYSAARELIEIAKLNADVVCVSAHFMQENITEPSKTQLEIVSRLIEYGADVIIGTGPHVLQRAEFVEREDGTRAFVMYSLGNFISAQAGAMNLVSAVADITFVKSGDTGKVTIESAGFVPIVTHYSSGYGDIHLELFEDYSEQAALSHGVRASTPSFGRQYIEKLLQETLGSDFIENINDEKERS